MTITARLGLPLLAGNQAQKHVTHNESLQRLDDVVQSSALSRALSAPPADPAENDRYIVGDDATGLWSGEEGKLAVFRNDAWLFISPWTGFVVFIEDEGTLLFYDGAGYQALEAGMPDELQDLSLLGLGTTADAINPLAAKINKALFAAKTVAEGGDGDLRYTLSKEAASNTLSFLFQDNYSGRAEIGLAGDDDFHFKTSPDGSAWTEALKLNKTTGAITLAVDLAVSEGGTGASTASGARTNLGATTVGDALFTAADAAAARTSLGLGSLATQSNLTGAVTSTGAATSLGSFTSAQLAAALTDETGSGANVFATSPTIINPTIYKTAQITYNSTLATAQFTGDASDSSTIYGRFTNDSSGAAPIFIKSRNTTVNGHTVVQSGDAIGFMQFAGDDGTNYIPAAWIGTFVDGTPGTNDMPGRISLYTTADGAAMPTERVRINSAGITSLYKGANVASAAAITPTGNVFHVTGTTNITSINSTNITAGTRITIIFDGILTFTDGNNLKLANNFVTSADDTISLIYDGTNWYETGRSVN